MPHLKRLYFFCHSCFSL